MEGLIETAINPIASAAGPLGAVGLRYDIGIPPTNTRIFRVTCRGWTIRDPQSAVCVTQVGQANVANVPDRFNTKIFDMKQSEVVVDIARADAQAFGAMPLHLHVLVFET